MKLKLGVLLMASVFLVSGAGAQDVELNFNFNLFGGGSDNATSNQPDQQPQQQQQETQKPAIDRDHSGRDVENDPITSQEAEEQGGFMDSVSGFLSSLFG